MPSDSVWRKRRLTNSGSLIEKPFNSLRIMPSILNYMRRCLVILPMLGAFVIETVHLRDFRFAPGSSVLQTAFWEN